MYRRGHVGVTMLAYAPVAHLLLQRGETGLALLGFLGVYLIEPLPDKDFRIRFLRHRGTSHSLFSALVIGAVLGAVGLGVGGKLPFLSAGTLAGFGFAVGVAGVIAHLLCDVITESGIQPLLPLSKRRVSLSPVNADSTVANSALFGLGILALGVVVLAAVPAGLSPVDIAAGQSTTQSENQTGASVELDSSNNTTSETVVVSKVRLPKGGFVAIHDGGYAEAGNLRQSAITVSKYLKPGVHRNVTIPVKRSVPGIAANASRLNVTRGNLSAVAYQDTNNNTQYDYAATYGSADTPYQTQSGGAVADTEQVVIEANVRRAKQQSQPAPASIRLADQQLQQAAGHPSITISRVNLSKGGFVVIHDKRYLGPTRDPLNSAIGVSSYLKPGVHRNITIPLLNGSVTSTQTLVAVPYLDTNSNRTYDYVKTGGEVDYQYIARQNNSTVIVNDTATVSVEGTRGTFGGTATPTATTTATTTPIDTTTPFRVTNLSVSNRTAHVGDEVTVTARIANPTDSRLEGELALATAGTAVETQQVALFPRESRAVTFTHSYEAPGRYVIKVANHTQQIRIIEEGAPLTVSTTTAPTEADSNSSDVKARDTQSGGGLSITDIILLMILIIVLAGLGWALFTLRKRM